MVCTLSQADRSSSLGLFQTWSRREQVYGLHCPTWGCHLGLFASFSSSSRVRLAEYKSGSAYSCNSCLGEGWFGHHPDTGKETESPDGVWPWVWSSWRLALFQACFCFGLVKVPQRGRTPPSFMHLFYFWLKLIWGGFLSFARKECWWLRNADSFLSVTQLLLTPSPGDVQSWYRITSRPV